jgi:restriction system protein
MENGNPKIRYRIAWARTHLKGAGLITNSQRAIWSLTPLGQTATENDVERGYVKFQDRLRSGQAGREAVGDASETDEVEPLDADTRNWKQQILVALSSMSPEAFERLSQRLLREAGFRDVKVTGKPGDGGIDGVGVYRLSLISFQIYFQCKRYRSDRTVTGDDVRSFRGAMRGIGDKGLFITTARFTTSAQQEASRNGVEPIELIDGDALCDLLKQYRLGVNVTERSNEDVAIDTGFFKAI